MDKKFGARVVENLSEIKNIVLKSGGCSPLYDDATNASPYEKVVFRTLSLDYFYTGFQIQYYANDYKFPVIISPESTFEKTPAGGTLTLFLANGAGAERPPGKCRVIATFERYRPA